MATFKEGYLEDIESMRVGLHKVVTTYLNANYSDLKDDSKQDIPWKKDYSWSFFRWTHGEAGYRRALQLLQDIKTIKNPKELIAAVIRNSRDSAHFATNELYTEVLEHLRAQIDNHLSEDDNKYINSAIGYAVDSTGATTNSIYLHLITTALKQAPDLQELEEKKSDVGPKNVKKA